MRMISLCCTGHDYQTFCGFFCVSMSVNDTAAQLRRDRPYLPTTKTQTQGSLRNMNNTNYSTNTRNLGGSVDSPTIE